MSVQAMSKIVDVLTNGLEEAASRGPEDLYATLRSLTYSIGIMVPQYINEKNQPEIVPELVQSFFDGYLEGKKIAGDKGTVELAVMRF